MSSDGPQARPMRYPVTFTAKIVQFPYKHYFKHSWVFRYCIYSMVVCAPIFYKIEKLSFSPANVEKWEKKRLAEAAGHH